MSKFKISDATKKEILFCLVFALFFSSLITSYRVNNQKDFFYQFRKYYDCSGFLGYRMKKGILTGYKHRICLSVDKKYIIVLWHGYDLETSKQKYLLID